MHKTLLWPWKADSIWPTTPRIRFAWPHYDVRAIGQLIAIRVSGITAYIGLGAEVWRVLDKCHNTRNLGEYEGLLDVDERLVADLISATETVLIAIQQ